MHPNRRSNRRCILLLAMSALLATASANADTPRRVLHVSLYPYIPEAAEAALTLKQSFERQHPDIIVDVTFNPNYYSPKPADKGVLFESADIHEIDDVFLRDFIDQRKLAPLPPNLVSALDKLDPLAAQAATVDDKFVAVPHWMCADFLIYRADQSGLAGAPTLVDMEHALAPSHGLLMDMTGSATLGEYYLSALIARDNSAAFALSHVTAKPDPVILARLRRFLALEPAGFGRNADYDIRGNFYARQFARRAGSAFVGYSEMTHEVLEETAGVVPRPGPLRHRPRHPRRTRPFSGWQSSPGCLGRHVRHRCQGPRPNDAGRASLHPLRRLDPSLSRFTRAAARRTPSLPAAGNAIGL